MAKYKKEEALKIILEAAKNYEEKLRGKYFIIFYQENNIVKYVEVGFRDLNFLHLTGVKSHLSAQLFYSSCIDKKLSEKDFEFDKQGKVQQKLLVLPYLSGLLYNSCMIGEFINSGICLKADYFVGNTKVILSLGFKNGIGADYPVTLYREDVRKLTHPTNRVLAIFKKEYNQKKYSGCTYLAKGCEESDFDLENR